MSGTIKKRRKRSLNTSTATKKKVIPKKKDCSSINQESPLDALKSAIAKVRNMTWTPSVCIFNIEWEDSLSAVDINLNHSLLACAGEKSPNIYVKIQPEKKLSQTDDENLLLNYNTLRVAKEEYEKTTAHLSTDRYLFGHSLPVTGLKFVPKKDLLLSSSLDGTVRVWNTESLIQVQQYSGVKDFFCDIDVSCNSSHFAASSFKGTVSLFSFEMTVPEKMFSGHTEDVNCVRFHPNGIYFATASSDKSIKLWCTQSGNVARTFQDDGCPRTLAFSPDGKYLASYSRGNIKMWDLASGQLLTTLKDSSNESIFYNLCFSEFGGILASGGLQKELKLWDVNNLTSEKQEKSGKISGSSKSHLLKSYSLSSKIKLIKFDENNCFTCVTV